MAKDKNEIAIKIWKCTDCRGNKKPCIFMMINTNSKESLPEYCPHGDGKASWKTEE